MQWQNSDKRGVQRHHGSDPADMPATSCVCENSERFNTLLFRKNLDRSKLWSFSYLHFRYRNRKAWYETLTKYLKSQGLQPSTSDPCLFHNPTKTMHVAVFVDGLLVSSVHASDGERFFSNMNKHKTGSSPWKVRNLGRPTNFLGLEINWNKYGVKLTHVKMIERLVERFHVCKEAVHTPMTAGKTLEPYEFADNKARLLMPSGDATADAHAAVSSGNATTPSGNAPTSSGNATRDATITDYRSITGTIAFIAGSARPECSYVAKELARNLSAPTA
jgi:hypothetical protein